MLNHWRVGYMSERNVWELQVYPLSNFKSEFNTLSTESQDKVLKLISEIIILPDPEDHNFSFGCPGIQGFNNAIKFIITTNLVLIVALDRIDSGVQIDRVITLYSCSE